MPHLIKDFETDEARTENYNRKQTNLQQQLVISALPFYNFIERRRQRKAVRIY